MNVRRVVLVTLVTAIVEHHARAGGFVDLAVGGSRPQGDQRYDAMIDTGLELGLHGGPTLAVDAPTRPDAARLVLGLDLGVARTWLNEADDADPVALTRWRLTAGPRLTLRSPISEAFVRVGVGVDRVHMDTTDLLEALCGDPTVQSPAIEGAFGAGANTGRFVIGAQVGVAYSDHGGDLPPCKPVNGQLIYVDTLDTRNVDVNFQLFVGARL